MNSGSFVQYFKLLVSQTKERVGLTLAICFLGISLVFIIHTIRWIFPKLNSGRIFQTRLYSSSKDINSIKDIDLTRSHSPSLTLTLDRLEFSNSRHLIVAPYGNTGFTENFWLEAQARFQLSGETSIDWSITSDDGFQLYIDEKLILEFAGVRNTAEDVGTINLQPGNHLLRFIYFQRFGKIHLQTKIRIQDESKAFLPWGINTSRIQWMGLDSSRLVVGKE